ncbi:UNVERIFIED_CONTAM: hypothetical protein Slati_4260000 [Sesamum latifolium]|uniref:Integrase catalytic domain-containing protein n=1 Tax=Sesamum latifolium TaxID=2727402 RepID=A0AAW2TFI9_9LAMI
MIAGQLAKLASSSQFNGGRKITCQQPAVNSEGKGRVARRRTPSLTWTTPIVQFLTEGTLPEDRIEARKVKLRSARFVLIDGDLYKRGFSYPMLKCLSPDRAKYVLREIHEGSCGNHSGARSLARKVLRQGSIMLKDASTLFHLQEACKPSTQYRHLHENCGEPLPIRHVGNGYSGQITTSDGKREYLIVVVNYFTKWVEAEPLAKISEKEVMKFIW